MKIVRRIIVVVLIIAISAISISALSGVRETKVRSPREGSQGKVIRFID